MTAATIEPINRTPSTALTRALGPVPAGEEWSVAVRVCVSGAGDDIFDLQLRKSDGSNVAYRARAHPVGAGSGTYDIETRLNLMAGYELWHRSGAGYVDASYTGTRRATA